MRATIPSLFPSCANTAQRRPSRSSLPASTRERTVFSPGMSAARWQKSGPCRVLPSHTNDCHIRPDAPGIERKSGEDEETYISRHLRRPANEHHTHRTRNRPERHDVHVSSRQDGAVGRTVFAAALCRHNSPASTALPRYGDSLYPPAALQHHRSSSRQRVPPPPS